jgi:tetratricopeptide (TPR) repeat protein
MLAIKQADKLKDRHDYAGAWDQISQPLADNPDSADLLLCAGRIYAASGRSKEAMEYFDKAYQQDSSNIDVLRGVIAGAIAAHEYGQASDYLAKAMEVDPQNPWLFYLKAQIAQARGHNGEAVEALRQARALNLQKGGPDSVVPGAPTSAATAPGGPPGGSTGGSTTAPPPANPFRRSQSTLPTQTNGARS